MSICTTPVFSHYLSHAKSGFLVGYPIILSMLGHVIMGVSDSVMVGWTGTVPLAACSLGNSIFMFPLFFGIGISYAGSPLVSEAYGANHTHKAADVLKHGRLINLAFGVLMTGLLYLLLPVMYHINQPPEVVEQVIPFLIILIPSLIPLMTFQTFRQFAEGLQFTRMAMIVMLSSDLLNIGLNYLLIFGNWGFPALGLQGAAIGTLIARMSEAVGMYVYIYYGKNFQVFRKAFTWGNYSLSLIKKMLHIGIPTAGQLLSEAGAFAAAGILMGWISTEALAAHQIAISIANMGYMITSGLGAAATIRAGYFFGKKDFSEMRTAAWALIILSTLIMVGWAALFIIFRNELPLFYSHNKEVISLASVLIIIMALFELADGSSTVFIGALRGMQDVKIPALLIFFAHWILALPIGWLLAFPFNMGAVGIWIALLIGLASTALFLGWRFYYFSHRVVSS